MNDYDSDSSGGDDGIYTSTSVLLGFPTKDPTDDNTSRLGGLPSWIDGKTAPSGAVAKCGMCNGFTRLLMQLHGDLPERFPGHDRWLYVFICPKKACRRKSGCIRAIRGHRVDRDLKPAKARPEEQTNPPKTETPRNVGAALFGVSQSSQSANPFARNGSSTTNPFASASSSSSNPFATLSDLAAKPAQKPGPDISTLPETFASKAKISAESTDSPAVSRPHEPWPDNGRLPSPYPTFYFDAEYETLSEYPNSDPKLQATMDLGDDGAESRGGAEELFESTMDKVFQKFADIVEQNPEQALRYEFGGQPLLYSSTDTVGKMISGNSKTQGHVQTISSSGKIPRCANCSQPRTFEAQLMPHAITVLEEDEMSLDGMDWGTIIVGVCSKDCSPRDIKTGEVGYLEEWVGVQWEEISSKR